MHLVRVRAGVLAIVGVFTYKSENYPAKGKQQRNITTSYSMKRVFMSSCLICSCPTFEYLPVFHTSKFAATSRQVQCRRRTKKQNSVG